MYCHVERQYSTSANLDCSKLLHLHEIWETPCPRLVDWLLCIFGSRTLVAFIMDVQETNSSAESSSVRQSLRPSLRPSVRPSCAAVASWCPVGCPDGVPVSRRVSPSPSLSPTSSLSPEGTSYRYAIINMTHQDCPLLWHYPKTVPSLRSFRLMHQRCNFWECVLETLTNSSASDDPEHQRNGTHGTFDLDPAPANTPDSWHLRKLIIFDDIAVVIQVIEKERSPTLRHVTRTQR